MSCNILAVVSELQHPSCNTLADTRDEALEWARVQDVADTAIWGLIDVLNTSVHYEYSLLTHYNQRTKPSTLLLQSLVSIYAPNYPVIHLVIYGAIYPAIYPENSTRFIHPWPMGHRCTPIITIFRVELR